MRRDRQLRHELEQRRLIGEIADMRDPPPVVRGRKGLRAFTRERVGFREIEVVARRGKAVALRCLIIPPSDTRPEGLPRDVPFIPGLGSCAEIGSRGGEPSMWVTWPCPQPARPDVEDLVSGLRPPPHTDLRHPRRFAPVVNQLLAHYRREFRDDDRTQALVDIARLAESRIRPIGEPIDEDEWMSEAHMEVFRYACETAGMPGETLRRLERGFDRICRSLEEGGWEMSEPEWRRWTPLPARNWVDCFRRGGESISLLRWPEGAGRRSLQLLRGPEGVHAGFV